MPIKICPSLEFTNAMVEVFKNYLTPKQMEFETYMVDNKLLLVNPANGARLEFSFNYLSGIVTVSKRTYKDVIRTASDNNPYMERVEDAFEYGSYAYKEMPTFKMYLDIWSKEQIRA